MEERLIDYYYRDREWKETRYSWEHIFLKRTVKFNSHKSGFRRVYSFKFTQY